MHLGQINVFSILIHLGLSNINRWKVSLTCYQMYFFIHFFSWMLRDFPCSYLLNTMRLMTGTNRLNFHRLNWDNKKKKTIVKVFYIVIITVSRHGNIRCVYEINFRKVSVGWFFFGNVCNISLSLRVERHVWSPDKNIREPAATIFAKVVESAVSRLSVCVCVHVCVRV